MRSLVLLSALGLVAGNALFKIPDRYSMLATFQIPYYNFSEGAYVWADRINGGAQRLEYHGGANVFIQNNQTQRGIFWNIHPAEDQLLCTATPLYAFTRPFPTLDQFTSTGNYKMINGINCQEFSYTFTDPAVNPNSNSNYNPPNGVAPGYVGNYFWYQSAADGSPVRFHTKYGHNVVFGGSHYDEYIVDYTHFETVQTAWPLDFFQPPGGMPCSTNANPFGPTEESLKTYGLNEPLDFESLYPEGHAKRRQLADVHARAHVSLLKGEMHSNHAMLRLHSTARYVGPRNRWLAAKGHKYTVGLNALAHLTHDERKKMSAGYRATAHTATEDDVRRLNGRAALGAGQPADECKMHTMTGRSIPGAIDLTNRAFPAKDQGTCGSCWSFGATGALEGAFAAVDGKLPEAASQQNLMDCTWHYGNAGCGGGNDYTAFSFLIAKNDRKIAQERAYGKYLNKDGFCHFDISRNWTSGGAETLRFNDCVHVNAQFNSTTPVAPPKHLTTSLNDVMANMGRPVSVAIDATRPDFYYYTGGDYYDPTCLNGVMDLDHQVLAVGYKTTPDGKMWTKIRNSWSDHWGVDGYVWIGQENNSCGVATSPNYITLDGEAPGGSH